MTNRATLDISGGGSTARYFVSASYINEDGMYKVDKAMKDFDTNSTFQRWNYRMNVDFDVTKTTMVTKFAFIHWHRSVSDFTKLYASRKRPGYSNDFYFRQRKTNSLHGICISLSGRCK